MRPTTGTDPALPVALAARARPTDVDEAREAFAAARADDLAVLAHGGGTKLDWGATPSPSRRWLGLDTRGLDAIVHHEPGDMTAIVEAGVPLATLQAALAEHGQHWAVDPPHADGPSGDQGGATVGGVFAANADGPHRHRYGGVRDLVIGIAALLPDGTVARSGGTVIKNVAGYDLAKLHCGALGTLGLVVRLALRLHPLPEAARTVEVAADAPTAAAILADLLASPVEAAAIEWTSADGGLLAVRVEGRADAVGTGAEAVAALARRHADAVRRAEPAGNDTAGDDARWTARRDAHAGTDGTTVVRASARPADLAAVATSLEAAAADGPVTATLHSHAGIGLHDAVLEGGDAAAHAAVVARWRAAVAGRGGSVVLRRRLPGTDEHVDAWLDPTSVEPPTLAVMRALKGALDPEGRCAPGRFVGGI